MKQLTSLVVRLWNGLLEADRRTALRPIPDFPRK
jgi:hypothetical protein